MTLSPDAEAMLMYFMEILPDEQEWKRIVSEISQETGLSREKVETVLHAMYEMLAEDLPQQ